MFKVHDHIEFKYKQEFYKGTTLQWCVIIQILKQVTHNHDNHHCVLKTLKVFTGMVPDHIDLR